MRKFSDLARLFWCPSAVWRCTVLYRQVEVDVAPEKWFSLVIAGLKYDFYNIHYTKSLLVYFYVEF